MELKKCLWGSFMLKILAHRGMWKLDEEKNSATALQRALNSGFGFESDVRDYKEELVISHNVASVDSLKAEQVFGWLSKLGDKYTFAINIKADGLKDMLKDYFEKNHLKNYFLFDMSVPQMIEYEEAGLRFFTRQSEVEKDPVMYDKANGVWVDGFWGESWITEELLKQHIDHGKEICLVSPELHGRNSYMNFWKELKSYDLDFSKVYLCTDLPEEARGWFENED